MEELYVLPYGQMSLWGATVITNLMSAIPWIGQNIVEFLLTTTHIYFDNGVLIAATILPIGLVHSVLPTIGVIN